jgi:2-polyprenyl-3-methyl-5-hydroxy-6-metoxy-1,4-benzoquinol methylase
LRYTQLRDGLFDVEGRWDIRSCDNGACRCLWLDPCPTPEAIGVAYNTYYTHGMRARWVEQAVEQVWGFAAKSYLAARFADYEAGLPRAAARAFAFALRAAPELFLHLELLLRHLPAPRPGQTLLDIGCGEGLALKVLDSVGWDVQGQDFDDKAVRAAASRGLRVHHGSIESCAFASASFDAVTMSHVIEHVHEPASFLREILRILKPNGTLVSITPNVLGANHQRFASAWRGLEPPRHLVMFSAPALSELALRVGFNDARVTSSVRSNRVSELASRAFLRRGKARWNEAGTRADRLIAAYGFYKALLSHDGEQLRGDELILTATK